MIITKQIAATQLLQYLQHKISLNELVNWAEEAVQEGDFQENENEILRTILGEIGLANVRNFGLSWEDCVSIMQRLGYTIHIEATLAA